MLYLKEITIFSLAREAEKIQYNNRAKVDKHMSVKTSQKPKQVTKKILSPLQDRAFEVVVCRFGLGEKEERETLESIGERYGITRERVRQIENAALQSIRKSDEFKSFDSFFEEIKNVIKGLGSVITEDELLQELAKDKSSQNHFLFYLVLSDLFNKEKEDEHFKSRWHVDSDVYNKVHAGLSKFYDSLGDDELIPESEFVDKFLTHLKDLNQDLKDREVVKRWLNISKKIGQNPLKEYGKADTSGVKVRGVKDYAFLVMRKHGNPMHFREVAKSVADIFGKKAHVATIHNELIKDLRFVLVGRGYYALKEWGYEPGAAREVIKKILKQSGPLSKEEVVEKVMKERFLKKNTILVNLQNAKYFKKNKQGLYTPV